MGGLVKAIAGPVFQTVGGLISGGKAAQAANLLCRLKPMRQ